MELALSLGQKRIPIEVRATRPAVAGDGTSIASWRVSGGSPIWFSCFIDGDQALTLNGVGDAGLPEVWLRRADRGAANSNGGWSCIGFLGKGAAIAIAGVGQGWAESLQFVGTGDELAIVGVPSVGAATAEAEPVETHSGW